MSIRSAFSLTPSQATSARLRPAFLVMATVVACSATSAMADLTLTPAGVARFGSNGLTVFASGFPQSAINLGPLGMDFQQNGTVLVTTGPTGTIQRFANIDGQLAPAVPVLATYGTGGAAGLARVGATTYMAQSGGFDRVVQLNSDGSINRVVATGITSALGLVASPTTGHLFATTNAAPFRIVDIDPVSGATTTIDSNRADGLTLSFDSTILYAARANNHLVGYNVATHAVVFDSGLINQAGVDGTALGFGSLAGNVYLNTTSGFLIEVNLTTLQQTVMASGGSRGDFVTADPTGSGDLLITQSDRILRLRGIPAPSTAALLGFGGLMAARRRR